jgi:hypothetical protein
MLCGAVLHCAVLLGPAASAPHLTTSRRWCRRRAVEAEALEQFWITAAHSHSHQFDGGPPPRSYSRASCYTNLSLTARHRSLALRPIPSTPLLALLMFANARPTCSSCRISCHNPGQTAAACSSLNASLNASSTTAPAVLAVRQLALKDQSVLEELGAGSWELEALSPS